MSRVNFDRDNQALFLLTKCIMPEISVRWGKDNMKIDDRSLYRAKQKDMVALLDALQELFQESGDEVTPKQIKERMEQKLQTQVPLHLVVSAYTSLGFVSRKGRKHGDRTFYYPQPRVISGKTGSILKC